MAAIEFYSDGKLHRLTAQPPDKLTAPKPKGAKPGVAMLKAGAGPMVKRAIHVQSSRLGSLFHSVSESSMLISLPKTGDSAIVPTTLLIVEGASKAELKKLKDDFGLEVIDEGSEGKVLLRAPEQGEAGVKQAAAAAKQAYERGNVAAAHPNFVRVMRQIKPSAAGGQPLWNHNNDGNPGVPGADVAAPAAWTLTKGKGEVRVAVLDEGVDTDHPALKAAVVAEKDFVDGNPSSTPDRDDAHGTACAGIIVSRDTNTPGLAPMCSLIAIRIAKGDGADGWVFDDFKTADAIDWAWKDSKADVLSNSWGGGPPVDVISRAFERARTKGRGGKGCVLAIAAGNSNQSIQYPATLPDVVAVGASSPWDERKSPTSKDGENWWGSCFGPELSLLAPGVKIATTDIQGAAGYGPGNFVTNFNGTSSATPHVAAAAALILSLVPGLTEKRVREIIMASADRLTANGKWDKFVGWGRLNLFAALRMARRP
jgi:subtilisin family serine protease